MKHHPSFVELRKELVRRGYFRREPGRIWLELSLFIAATLAGIALLIAAADPWLDMLAMLLVTWGGMGMSTNAHMASHNAISERDWVNRALTYFGYPFFLQVSASYWRQKHLVVHHPHPNVMGTDDDADLAPYFAISRDELERAGGWRRRLYRYQWLYMPILMVGNAFNVVITGWRHLLGRLLDPAARSVHHWLDLSALLLHLAVWLLLPMLVFAPGDVILFNLARFSLMSYGMFALFAPGHFPEEAQLVDKITDTTDRVLLQTATTVNFRTGFLGRLLCGGVEYQIEHHLFPAISHVHLPEVSRLVRRYCEQHGYPYHTLGWGEAIWKSMVNFYRPKPVAKTLEDPVDRSREIHAYGYKSRAPEHSGEWCVSTAGR